MITVNNITYELVTTFGLSENLVYGSVDKGTRFSVVEQYLSPLLRIHWVTQNAGGSHHVPDTD